MANLHTPNTTPEENNQEPRKFPWDFLGRYDCMIVVGRTREENGKKIYEVSGDIRHGTKEEDKRRIEISEQEHLQIKQEYEEEDKKLKEKEALEKKLKKIGAIHETGYGDRYINLLFDVLDEHQIVTLEEISEHSRQKTLKENKIDYSYPFDNPLIGARSYTKDGATIYEIQEPLSDDYYLVTEERYQQFITQRKDIRNKEREKTQKQVEKYTKLNKLGYYQNQHRNSEEYEDHLINTLEENNISHIKEIPTQPHQDMEAIESPDNGNPDKNNIALQLFQGLAQSRCTPDIYEQEIISHLERCEAIIEHRYIDTYSENDFLKISQLFSTGYIKNLELFYRFEKLKKQNIINHYKKLYTYGSVTIKLGRNKYGSMVDIERYNTEESTSITQYDFETMMYLIYANGDTIIDLGDDREMVIQKIKNGYKNRWKEYFIGKEQFMPNPKHGFSDLNFKRLGINIETKQLRAKEAEDEFVNEFGTMLENILNEKIENEGNTENIGGIILKIKENIESNPENIVLQKNIADLLYQKINILIEKIQNKEKIEKTDWRNKRDLSYKNHIIKLCNSIEMLHKGLKSLDPLLAEQIGWQQNKDKDIHEYKEYFRNKFIERRKQDFAKMDLTDIDAVKQKIVQDVKARFYKRATTRGKRRAESLNFNGFISKDESSSRGNKGVIGSLVGSFFDTGHALLLKNMYPDEKERTEIRRAYSQQIIEELISEIQDNLTNESTFKWEEYLVVRPMLHVYKKYGGKKNILTKKDKINETIYATRKKDFEILGYQRVKETEEASHDQKSTISDKEKYELVHYLRWFMRSYISYFAEEKGLNLSLHQPTDKEKGIIIKEKNQKRSTIATEACIDDLSFFGADIDELEATIDQDIFNMILDIYNQVDAPTENIIDQILQNRFTRNTQAGGKLQRIIEDYLKKTFGSIDLDESQMESILIYLNNNLVQIILQDLIGPDQDIKILERDQKRINTYIKEYIEHLKKNYQNFKALQ